MAMLLHIFISFHFECGTGQSNAPESYRIIEPTFLPFPLLSPLLSLPISIALWISKIAMWIWPTCIVFSKHAKMLCMEIQNDLRLCINFNLFIHSSFDVSLLFLPFVLVFSSFFLVQMQIRLDSASILMPNLKIVQPASASSSSSSSALPSTYDHHHQPGQQQQPHHHHKIYQLCACSNGKLFLAMSHSICAGDESTVCRWFDAIHKMDSCKRKIYLKLYGTATM